MRAHDQPLLIALGIALAAMTSSAAAQSTAAPAPEAHASKVHAPEVHAPEVQAQYDDAQAMPADTPSTAPAADAAASCADDDVASVACATDAAEAVGGEASAASADDMVDETTGDADEESAWSTRWPLLALHQSQRFARDTPINPDNRLYRFHDGEQRLELRPELRYSRGGFSLDLSPRAVAVRARGLSGGERWRTQDETLRLRYGRVQYARGGLSLRAGRYVNLWGPSVLVSPSNPFHSDSGQTSPQTELDARDHLEATYAFDDRFAVTAIANVGEGDQTAAGFRRVGVVRLDYTGDTASHSALLIHRSDSIAFGGYGQWTPNDSWVLYWDGLARQGRSLDAYPRDGQLLPDRSRTVHTSLLLGAAYSFADGTTLSLEGYRNGSGLRDDEREALFDLQQQALGDLGDPAAAAQAAQTLRRIGAIPLTRMGRHYAMARLQRSNLRDQVDLGALYLRNLDDSSDQITLRADWYATDTLQLFSYWTRMRGGTRSEFGRFFDDRLTAGLRWSFR